MKASAERPVSRGCPLHRKLATHHKRLTTWFALELLFVRVLDLRELLLKRHLVLLPCPTLRLKLRLQPSVLCLETVDLCLELGDTSQELCDALGIRG